MLGYYVPYGWILKTRLGKFTFVNAVSFFMNYMFPSAYFVFLYQPIGMETILVYLLAFTGMFVLYECGYIFNDLVTTQFEDAPTERIPKTQLRQFLRRLESLLALRSVIFLGVTWYLFHVRGKMALSYLALGGILVIGYALHNFYRGPVNRLTVALLFSCKFVMPLAAFLNVMDIVHLYPLLFITSILEQVLFYREKMEYGRDAFRLIYDVGVFCVVALFVLFDIYPVSYLRFSSLLLAFRGGGFYAMRHSYILKAVESRRYMNELKAEADDN